jgi:hypothetical protein
MIPAAAPGDRRFVGRFAAPADRAEIEIDILLDEENAQQDPVRIDAIADHLSGFLAPKPNPLDLLVIEGLRRRGRVLRALSRQ